MGEITPLHPATKWAQRKDRLMLTIELSDCQKPNISITSTHLHFSAKGGKEQKIYSLDLEFHKDVVPAESKQHVTAREISFNIKKKEEGPYWPRLLKDPKKPSFLHTDFNRWRDEDDSEEEDTAIDDNFEAMMNQMGAAGGQGFDPGDAGESDDSDDDGFQGMGAGMLLEAGSRLISPAKKSLPPTQIVLENKDRGSFEEAVSALLIRR